MAEKIQEWIGWLIGMSFIGGFIAWFFFPILWYRPLQRAVQQTAVTRTQFVAELQRAELVTMTLNPRVLHTAQGAVAEKPVQICTGLPITAAVRAASTTHWFGFQPAFEPTSETVPKPMEAFPSADAPIAWLLLPPLRDGQPLGFQLTPKGFGCWTTDRYRDRVFRFRARAVPWSQPPRYRLAPINEVDIEPEPYGWL